MRFHKLTAPLLMAIAAAAQAHTHLEGSAPADKSRVKAPAAIELHFSEAARLTALSLQKGAEAARPIRPLPAETAANISVPMPALTPGDYVVSWRVAGDDGHVVSGRFGFTVDPAAPDATTPMPEGMKMGGHDHMDQMKSADGKKEALEDQHKH